VEEREWFTTPNGNRVEMFYRGDTNDRSVIESIMTDDEYQLRGQQYTGWAVDVGAHVGGWAISIAKDNPHLYVLALEAVYENVLLMQRNVKLNELEAQVKPLYRAASSSNHMARIQYGFKGDPQARIHRYIGNQAMPADTGYEVQTVQGLRLTRLRRMIGEDIRIMKIDCEGCEWAFLRGSGLASIQEIVGEWHERNGQGSGELLERLAGTHSVTISGDGYGPFRAVKR
jgi:FkbM family methyltransferase